MNISFIFLFIASLLASRILCEQSEFFPIGDIVSAVSDVKSALSDTNEPPPVIAPGTVPKINLKIVPSKKMRITKSDMSFLLTELKQEIARQMAVLTDELEEKERMRQRAAFIAFNNTDTITIPDTEEHEMENQEEQINSEETQEDVAEFINTLNEIANDENTNFVENRTYDIKIKNKNTSEDLSDSETSMSFRQRFRNGPVTV